MGGQAITRRGFLTGGRLRPATGNYPPGVTDASLRNCTGCGDCAEACPTAIIVMRDGVPCLDFLQGECLFCGRCAERCPERVFPPEPPDRFDHRAAIDADCLAVNFVDCQACRDACPSNAIAFRPRIGGPFLPVLDAETCTGCGACVSVCPTQSIAMFPRRVEETVHV